MPETPEEEHLPIPEVPADPIITPTQEPETMEVHHHAHHGGKKNWKSYFWEFLMLFLAVFCGFLAEYQLEHVVEHNREKQFVVSMIDDLKADSSRIGFYIEKNKQQVAGFDSLLLNIYHTPYTDSSLRILNYLKETHTLITYRTVFSKATLSQLKNSGGYRLIRNRAVADSIINYDIASERVENQGDAVEYSGKQLAQVSFKVFDGETTFGYNRTNYQDILTSNKKFPLLTDDAKLIKEYANLAKFKRDVILNYNRQLTALQKRIPGIEEFLKKEYHLD